MEGISILDRKYTTIKTGYVFVAIERSSLLETKHSQIVRVFRETAKIVLVNQRYSCRAYEKEDT